MNASALRSKRPSKIIENLPLQPIKEFTTDIESAGHKYASDVLLPKPRAFDVNADCDLYY